MTELLESAPLPQADEQLDLPAPVYLKSHQELIETADRQLTDLSQVLMPGLTEQRWGEIIGDDASGRLPTLFVNRLIDNMEQYDSSNRPRVDFLPAGYEVYMPRDKDNPDNVKNVDQRLDSLELDTERRALIITE